jgi:hypothetical protein
MRPPVVIVTDRFARLYWLFWAGSALFLGSLLAVGLLWEFLTFHWVTHVL